jgi:hypothetical protein
MAVVRTGSREDVDAAVRRALLKGRGSDPWSLLFRSLLLLALLVSLTFLVTLLAQSATGASIS